MNTRKKRAAAGVGPSAALGGPIDGASSAAGANEIIQQRRGDALFISV